MHALRAHTEAKGTLGGPSIGFGKTPDFFRCEKIACGLSVCDFVITQREKSQSQHAHVIAGVWVSSDKTCGHDSVVGHFTTTESNG